VTKAAGWSAIQKFALFAVILVAVAMYVRWSQSKKEKALGYEKTMA
jgi:hypothetical protein